MVNQERAIITSEPDRRHISTITLAEWEPVRERVRAVLDRDGLSVTELAHRVGIPAGSVIGYFDTEQRTPTPARLAIFLTWLELVEKQ